MSVYSEAAALLRKDGWCQEWFYKARRHCVLGAIQAVVNGNPDQRSARSEAVQDRLEDMIGGPLGLEDWNDEPGRSLEEVLALLEDADGATRAA